MGFGKVAALVFAGMLFVGANSFAQGPFMGEAPRMVTVGGQRYGIFYSWSDDSRAKMLIEHGTYDEGAKQIGIDRQAKLAAQGIADGNAVDAGLNVSTNPVESAQFGGRTGPKIEAIAKAKLVEVLVPEGEFAKVEYNEIGEHFDTKSWYTFDKTLKGSLIREFSGEGLTQAELNALPQKIAAYPEVADNLKIVNRIFEEKGATPISKFPSVEYIEKQVAKIVKNQATIPSPKVVPKINLPKTVPKEQVTGEQSFKAAISSEEEGLCKVPFSKTPTTLGLNATLGAAVNVLGAASIVMAAIDPEKNPFTGPAIGVDCGEAEAMNNRITCIWDNPMNPWNNIVHCQYLTKITHTRKAQFSLSYMQDREGCEIEWVQFSFELDPASKSKFKSSGMLDKHGTLIRSATGQPFTDRGSFLKDFQNQYKIIRPEFQNHSTPEKKSVFDDNGIT